MRSYMASTPLSEAMVTPVDGRTLKGMMTQILNLEASELTYDLGADLREHHDCLLLAEVFHKGKWEKQTAEDVGMILTRLEKKLEKSQWKPEILDKMLVFQVKILRDQRKFHELMLKIAPIAESELDLKNVRLNSLQKNEAEQISFFVRTLWRFGLLQLVADEELEADEMIKQLKAVVDYLRKVDLIEINADLCSAIRESKEMAEFLQMITDDSVGPEKHDLYEKVSKNFGKVGKTLGIAVCQAVDKSAKWRERRARLEGSLAYMMANEENVSQTLGALEGVVDSSGLDIATLQRAVCCIVQHRKGFRPNYFSSWTAKLDNLSTSFIRSALDPSHSNLLTLPQLTEFMNFAKSLMGLSPNNSTYPECFAHLEKIFQHQGSIKYKSDVIKTVGAYTSDVQSEEKLKRLQELVNKLTADLSGLKASLEPLMVLWLAGISKAKPEPQAHWKASAECGMSLCDSGGLQDKKKRFKVFLNAAEADGRKLDLQALGDHYDARVVHPQAMEKVQAFRKSMLDWEVAVKDVGGEKAFKADFLAQFTQREGAQMVLKGSIDAMMKHVNSQFDTIRDSIVGLIGVDDSYDVKWPDGATNMEKLRENAKKHIYNDHAKEIKSLRDKLKKAAL